MRELEHDPEYQRKFQAAEAERQVRVAKLRRAEQPIVAALRAAGVQVNSVWDLVNTAEPYPDALPVLMEFFEQGGFPGWVMQSLGRALAVKPSVIFWDRLKARYLEARSDDEEETAAVALAACATPAQFDDLTALLTDGERGSNRVFFVRPVLNLGGQRGRDLVQTLRDDPTVGKEARALLRTRRK